MLTFIAPAAKLDSSWDAMFAFICGHNDADPKNYYEVYWATNYLSRHGARRARRSKLQRPVRRFAAGRRTVAVQFLPSSVDDELFHANTRR
jgi:hypothetical protein